MLFFAGNDLSFQEFDGELDREPSLVVALVVALVVDPCRVAGLNLYIGDSLSGCHVISSTGIQISTTESSLSPLKRSP